MSLHRPSAPIEAAPSRDQRRRELAAFVVQHRLRGAVVDLPVLRNVFPELAEADLIQQLSLHDEVLVASKEARSSAPLDVQDPDDPVYSEAYALLAAHLSGYELLEPVRYGGQGVVYKAFQLASKRNVAIKLLLGGPKASEHHRRRFEREIELISRLRHPNIVSVYECGMIDGRLYYTMEFIEGNTIVDYVISEMATFDQTIRLFINVCRTVAYAHQRGVIHRDLSPGNMLVDMDGGVRILDFGLAKDASPNDAAARSEDFVSGGVVGTWPYSSPEQVDSHDGQADVRSDIYSLGVVLYQLLTGVLPYPIGPSNSHNASVIMNREPERLAKTLQCPYNLSRPGLSASADLQAILDKVLSKEKSERYQSAGEFADDLEQLLAGEVVSARAHQRAYLLRKAIRRYRIPVTVALCFSLLLGASFVVTLELLRQASWERDNAREATRLAHSLFHRVTGEIDDRVSTLAGGTVIRDELLASLSDQIPALTGLMESDGQMDDLLISLHEQQGDMAYSLGRSEEAAEHYRQVVERIGKKYGVPWSGAPQLQTLARTHRKLAQAANNDLGHYQTAVAIARSCVDRTPHDVTMRCELAAALIDHGAALFQAGAYEDAGNQLAQALELFEEGGHAGAETDRARDLRANAYEWDGEIRLKLGEGDRGFDSLHRAIVLRREDVAARPSDVVRRNCLLTVCSKLGFRLLEDGEDAASLELLTEALEQARYLVFADPEAIRWKADLFGVLDRYTRVLVRIGTAEQARSAADEAFEVGRSLFQVDPAREEWQRILAVSYHLQGQTYLKERDPETGLAYFHWAIQILEGTPSFLSGDPAVVSRVASEHDWAGRCARRNETTEEALDHFLRAQEIRESLTRTGNETHQIQVDRLHSTINVSTALLLIKRADDDELAGSLLDEAARTLTDLETNGELERRGYWEKTFAHAIAENREIICRRNAERASEIDSVVENVAYRSP